MAEVSLGSAEPLGDGSAGGPSDAAPEDEADGDGSGAVGVGTGGKLQPHSGVVGFIPLGLVRTGLTFRGGRGRPVVGSVAVAIGTGVAGFSGRVPLAGTRPIPAFGANVSVTAGRGGSVPATASWLVSDPRPVTTPRYAPAAPSTVSTPNPVTTTTLRRGRGGGGGGGSWNTGTPNVFIPVEVTSGPPDGGSTGRCPRSYRTERHAPVSSERVLRNRLIELVLRSGTL